MLYWLVPLVGGIGFLATRSWRQDSAIRSGELMDVRDVLPSGEADLEVRVLANRRYRVELQFEAQTGLVEPGTLSPETSIHEAAFPFQLIVEHADSGAGGVVYERSRVLEDFFPVTHLSPHGGNEAARRYAGAIPLLEFVSDGLVRLRFDLSIAATTQVERRGQQTAGRLDKAYLVIKEDVRPWRMKSALLDHIEIAAREII